MNVLHVVENLNMGGAERVVVDLVNHASDRFTPSICCLETSGATAALIRRAGVKVHELRKKPGNDATMPFKIADIVKRENIDVLHSHNWATFVEAGAAGIISRARVRVHTQHGESVKPAAGFSAMVKKNLRTLAETALARHFHAIIAVSEQVRENILHEHAIDALKITVVRNGISVVPVDDVIGLQKRHDLGIEYGAVVVLAVGRLAEVKNFSLLIKAFAQMKRSVTSPVVLLIAGEGGDRPTLEMKIRERNVGSHVRLLGARTDIGELLAAGDLYVVSSFSEGVSIALLEAMAAGLPVIATRVGGNGEVVNDGVTGLLVPSNDEGAMADALLKLVCDPTIRARMGQAGTQRVLEKFNIAKTVESIEKIYSDIEAGRRGV